MTEPETATAGAGARPQARYGDQPRRRAVWVALGAAAAALALGWLTWVALYHANPDVNAGLLAYDVTSPRTVSVTIEVVKAPDVAATCVIRARDADGVEVGRQEVAVPAGERRTVVTSVLRTTGPAVSGELRGCRVVA